MIASPHVQDPSSAKSRLAIDQAILALRAGDPADAERTLRHRLLEAPNDLDVLAKLGDLLAEQGRLLDSGVAYKRALAVAPKAHHIRLALAHLFAKLGQYDAALKEVEAIEGPLRESFSARALEGAMLDKLGLHEREIAVYESMIADFPDREVLWMCLGNVLKTVGRSDEAVEAFRKAIKLRGSYGDAYWCLANLKTFQFHAQDIAAMRKALGGRISDEDAMHLHFALGKALEERDEVEESFSHYAAGNRIRASQLTPAQMYITPRIDSAIRTFTNDFFEARAGTGCKAPDPIFIMGLQRSGSTLIEQILASHPMIEGTAELVEIEQIWTRLGKTGQARGNSFAALAELKSADLEALGAEYLERTRAYRLTDRPLFVDKLPANWVNAGFIRLILPNAKIIDARRHPMACGFSNFRQNYATGVTFSYSLDSIGRFWRDYWRFMNHMDSVQPGAIHHVINERLIEDTETEVRKLLDYVGVPFDPACLEFHKTDRAVRSASSEQVRRPINRDGVDYWRRYEPWLGPLKQALGEALDNWDAEPEAALDEIRLARAQALKRQHQPRAALEEIEQLGPKSRSSFMARATEAAVLGEIGLHDRELALYEELVAAHPNDESMWVNYGNALKTVGRSDEAVRALRRAIKERPTFGVAYWSLANLKTFRFEDRDVGAMRQALQGQLAETDALHFHFALGKALEDRGAIEESFKHYVAGNRIRAAKLAPTQMELTPRVDATIRTFTKSLFDAPAKEGCQNSGPIFVVGLQRSGSTLVEQMLASHPMIEGVAELLVVDQLWSRLSGMESNGDPFAALEKLSPEARREFGAEYLERTRAFRLTDRPFFVDKQAGNWMNVGFIKLILPDARIIDTRRHPMACGFSNFKQHYDVGVFFSYSLESIGRCYVDYLRLMNHFDRVIPGAVHHVINERLIEDTETEVRKLLDYVGVPFDPACLEFHKTDRAVRSASSEQVRRPINRDGVDYWRRYEPWLGPLKTALGEALEAWDEIPGQAVQRAERRGK